MKKTIAVICILLIILTFTLIACDKTDNQIQNISCKDMLKRVVNANSITVKCNGNTVFMKDDNAVYWCNYYGTTFDEYYFSDASNGNNYVYCKEYGDNWVKEPMSDADFSEYCMMISDSYGIDEYAKVLLEYVLDNFDTVMAKSENSYVMATTAFGIVEDLTMRNDNTSLTATFNLYSSYYHVEFFAINSTKVNVPVSVLNAPVGSVYLP